MEKYCLDCKKEICNIALRCGSCAMKGNKNGLGHVPSKEFREVASTRMKNSWKDEEWRKKRTIAIKDNGFKKGMIPHSYIDGRNKKIGGSRYGKGWLKLRRAIYRRDNHTCQHCNSEENLTIHHKIPYLYSGDNSPDNLIILCRLCHSNAENKLDNKFKEIRINIINSKGLVVVPWR